MCRPGRIGAGRGQTDMASRCGEVCDPGKQVWWRCWLFFLRGRVRCLVVYMSDGMVMPALWEFVCGGRFQRFFYPGQGLSLLSASLLFGFRSATLGWLLFGKIEGGCQSKGARSRQKRLSVKLCRGSIPLKVSPSPSSAAELVSHYHIPPPCLCGK